MVRTSRGKADPSNNQPKRGTGIMFYVSYFAGVALGYVVYLFQS